MQLFAFLAAILHLKLDDTFEECVVNQLSQSMTIVIGSKLLKLNRGFSRHAASKEHLACYSIWKEKIKRSEMVKEITLLVNTEAIERNRYYFSTLALLVTHQLAFREKIDAFESKTKKEIDSF